MRKKNAAPNPPVEARVLRPPGSFLGLFGFFDFFGGIRDYLFEGLLLEFSLVRGVLRFAANRPAWLPAHAPYVLAAFTGDGTQWTPSI